MMNYERFAALVAKDARLVALMVKNDSAEGLTDAELDEMFRRLQRLDHTTPREEDRV